MPRNTKRAIGKSRPADTEPSHTKKGRVFIGTSGWNYKHWRGEFYPPRMPQNEWLTHYARVFDTVEVNNSFYILVKPSSYRRWKKTTPENFLFAVKGSRYLTHIRRLTDTKTGLKRFFKPLQNLAPKTGPILFQLPPHWEKNPERLDHFLAALPKGFRIVFEFRDSSWFSDEIYEILKKHKTAFCVYDFQGKISSPKIVTADWVYIRFHGPNAYGGKELKKTWLPFIQEQRGKGRDVYCYFNNDAKADALHDALTLKILLKNYNELLFRSGFFSLDFIRDFFAQMAAPKRDLPARQAPPRR